MIHALDETLQSHYNLAQKNVHNKLRSKPQDAIYNIDTTYAK
jgi:hypothetical protein